jgi:hypothetical protein
MELSLRLKGPHLISSSQLTISHREDVIHDYGTAKLSLTKQCFQEIIQEGMRFGDAFCHSHQLIGICLWGVEVACTGFEANEIREIGKKVFLLGGKFTSVVTATTTVLIARRMMSAKVYTALTFDTPIVSIEWIQTCFENLSRIPFESFVMPKFAGCIITSSELTPKQRSGLSKFVKTNGGVWANAFDTTCHCVISSTLSPSKKILLALEQNVPIISPEWFLKPFAAPFPDILNFWCTESAAVFDGLTFSVDDRLADSAELSCAIRMNQGKLRKPSRFCVLPHGCVTFEKSIAVTNHWVWASLTSRKVIDVDTSPLFQPLSFQCPVLTIIGTAVAVLNMDDHSRLEIAGILRDVGCTISYSFSKDVNLVVAHTADRNLRNLATEYAIPIVSVSWVIDVMRTGIFPNPESHELIGTTRLTLAECLELRLQNDPLSSPIERLSSHFS